MKMRLIVLCIIMMFVTTGCTVEGNRIYTVCKMTETATYVYNQAGEFFLYKDGRILPCKDGSLQAKPMLSLEMPESTEFNLEYVMPSVYRGALQDAMGYVSKLLLDDGGKYAILSLDCNGYEMLITSDTYDVRLLYSTDDTVRLYAVDKSGNSISPPYINSRS